jgi:orotidine-5'-phosphate decarboxylase
MMSCGESSLYEQVISKAQQWGNPDNLMFVIGATHPDYIRQVRELAPSSFFLVPGVGAQGGDLSAISERGMNDHCGLLINSSRGIIYAGQGENFGFHAGIQAKELQQKMSEFLT